jgi:hypothetical protein
MSIRGSSHLRSIGDPISFGDIPPEVVRKAFLHLSSSDVAAARLVCRGWNPTGQDVMMSRLQVKSERGETVFCGLNLRRLVGFNSFPIKSLEIDAQGINFICVLLVAQYAAHTLASLKFSFDVRARPASSFALHHLLSDCERIRHLELTGFDVGDDFAVQDEDVLRGIKDGLSRLTRLDLIQCRGNILSLVEQTEIPNLQEFGYFARGGDTAQESENIIMAVALKYRTLSGIRLDAEFDSSVGLLKVIERCPDLESLIYNKRSGDLVLRRSNSSFFVG